MLHGASRREAGSRGKKGLFFPLLYFKSRQAGPPGCYLLAPQPLKYRGALIHYLTRISFSPSVVFRNLKLESNGIPYTPSAAINLPYPLGCPAQTGTLNLSGLFN
jgi:hypothetical protein